MLNVLSWSNGPSQNTEDIDQTKLGRGEGGERGRGRGRGEREGREVGWGGEGREAGGDMKGREGGGERGRK